jgi:uncharacterized low-complexity protein
MVKQEDIMKIRKLASMVVLASALAFASGAQADCYSSGVRVGVIQKFSQKGIINKSWEGQMVQGGIRPKDGLNGTGISNIWKFSVTDSSVAKKIDDAVFDGGQVAVKYCQGMFKGFATDTSYIVTDIKVQK